MTVENRTGARRTVHETPRAQEYRRQLAAKFSGDKEERIDDAAEALKRKAQGRTIDAGEQQIVDELVVDVVEGVDRIKRAATDRRAQPTEKEGLGFVRTVLGNKVVDAIASLDTTDRDSIASDAPIVAQVLDYVATTPTDQFSQQSKIKGLARDVVRVGSADAAFAAVMLEGIGDRMRDLQVEWAEDSRDDLERMRDLLASQGRDASFFQTKLDEIDSGRIDLNSVRRQVERTARGGRHENGFGRFPPPPAIQTILEEHLATAKIAEVVNPDGTLDREKSAQLIREAVHTVNVLLEPLADPGADPREVWNDQIEGQHLRTIQAIIAQNAAEVLAATDFGNQENKRDFQTFINGTLLYRVRMEKDAHFMFHEAAFLLSNVDFEKLGGYVGRMKLSSIHALLTDRHMSSIMNEYLAFVQNQVAMAGNTVPQDLFAPTSSTPGIPGHGYFIADEARFVRSMETRFGDMEDWEMTRALRLARGMSLLVTFKPEEVLARAYPPEDFNQRWLQRILAVLNPQWNIGEGAGGRGISPSGWMRAVPIELTERSPIRGKDLLRSPARIAYMLQSRWVPTRVQEGFDAWKNKTEEMFELEMRKRGGLWLDQLGPWGLLYQKLRYNGAMSEGNDWARKSLEAAHAEKLHARLGADWIQTYDWFATEAGIGLAFLYDETRAGNEADLVLGRSVLGAFADNPKAAGEFFTAQKKAYASGDKRHERVMHVVIDGRGRDLTYRQYVNERTRMLQGWNFYRMMMHDPVMFLNNMAQVVPHVMDGYVSVACRRGGAYESVQVKASDYYFNLDNSLPRGAAITPAARQEHDRLLAAFQVRFGFHPLEEGGRNSAVWRSMREDLSVIMDMYTRLQDMGAETGGQSARSKDEMYRLFFDELRTAHGRLINPDGTWQASELQEEHFQESEMEPLLFGQAGILTHFRRKYQDSFGANTSVDTRGQAVAADLGQSENFFRLFAHCWFGRDHILTKPAGPINYRLFFSHPEESEQFTRKQIEDLAQAQALQKEALGIGSALKKDALAGKDEATREYHDKIDAMKFLRGGPACKELHGVAEVLIQRFFQENHLSRLPFPFNLPFVLSNKKLSFSKIAINPRALSMGSDALKGRIAWLKERKYIDDEGNFSAQAIEHAVGINTSLWLFEAVPNIMTIVIIVLLVQFIQQAYKEEEGGR